jgi:pyrroloquinoline-quinone synthase
MEDWAIGPTVKARAAEILEASGIRRNPYLESLRGGAQSLEAFRRTQEQFYFAVDYYPRPMAALLARIEDPEIRLDILRNLVEEHGEFDTSAFHRSTFRGFLESIGADAKNLDTRPVWPSVRAFNAVLAGACWCSEVEVGMGCLGIIELAFAEISAAIGGAVVSRGWVRREDLIHYSVHAELDIRHADDLFAAVDRLAGQSSRRARIVEGLELGIFAFDRLYRDLHDKGTRRELPA